MKTKHEPDYDKCLDDVHLWESKQLGADIRYAKQVSDAEDKALDDSLGLEVMTIRLAKKLAKKIKILAKKEGLCYQHHVRQLLTNHVQKVATPPKTKRATA